MTITMTYELAMAAARDEGNRSMKSAGRTRWNQSDYNAMVREFNRLWPSGTNTSPLFNYSRVQSSNRGQHPAVVPDRQA